MNKSPNSSPEFSVVMMTVAAISRCVLCSYAVDHYTQQLGFVINRLASDYKNKLLILTRSPFYQKQTDILVSGRQMLTSPTIGLHWCFQRIHCQH